MRGSVAVRRTNPSAPRRCKLAALIHPCDLGGDPVDRGFDLDLAEEHALDVVSSSSAPRSLLILEFSGSERPKHDRNG